MILLERWDPTDGGWQLVASARGLVSEEAVRQFLEDIDAPAGLYRAERIEVTWTR